MWTDGNNDPQHAEAARWLTFTRHFIRIEWLPVNPLLGGAAMVPGMQGMAPQQMMGGAPGMTPGMAPGMAQQIQMQQMQYAPQQQQQQMPQYAQPQRR